MTGDCTFEIMVWTTDGRPDREEEFLGRTYIYPDYKERVYWEGDNPFVALYQGIKAHREGHGCVTIKWR